MKGYTADHIDYWYFIFCVFCIKLFQVDPQVSWWVQFLKQFSSTELVHIFVVSVAFSAAMDLQQQKEPLDFSKHYLTGNSL